MHPRSTCPVVLLGVTSRAASTMTSSLFIIAALAVAMALASTASNAFPVAARPPPPPPSSSGRDDPFDRSAPWFRGYNNNNNPYWLDRYRAPARGMKTCVEAPGVCRAWGSPGPDCCGRQQCVNLAADFFNCGRCGRRCRFGEMCCGGRCASVFYDSDNCGICGNTCREGGFCRYGMCDYAS